MKKKTTQLRELFFGTKTFVLPGVCDGYEAKIVEASGFKACYMSGGRTSAAHGYPDAGVSYPYSGWEARASKLFEMAGEVARAVEKK